MKPHFQSKFPDSFRLPFRAVLTVVRYSLTGIHRTTWLKAFVGFASILPTAGFISQDTHLAEDPFKLFMDLHYGLQRYLVLAFACIALRALWRWDESPGTDSAIKAAGIRPFECLLGKNLALATLVIAFQFTLTSYTWLLGRIWTLSPSLSAETLIHAHASFPFMAASAWANALMVLVITYLIRLLWMMSGQVLLGYSLGFVITLAGFTQPVWSPYFEHTPDLHFIFRWFGHLLHLTIPALWTFDLWIIAEENPPHSIGNQLVSLSGLAFSWIFLLHITSWCVSHFKRT